MSVEISSSGKNARNATVNDLKKAIEEINLAIDELNKCKGLGAEIYIDRLESMIKTYKRIKSIIAAIG